MNQITDLLLFRCRHVCPRWLCFTFDNYFRRLIHKPERIVQAYIKEGNRVLDVGPGIGFFTIPMARMVGTRGQVVAADIQEEMLAAIRKRAARDGVHERINLQLVSSGMPEIEGKFDFILTFWMAHEVADHPTFFARLHSLLADNGRFLLVEPKLHVGKKRFSAAVQAAKSSGFKLVDDPAIPLSMSALFIRKEGTFQKR
jgi:cyclopropane fatty-acyl-phospholipid synthase-like methyltransferase